MRKLKERTTVAFVTNNNFTIQAVNIQTVCMYLQVIMPSWYANSLQLEEVLSLA